MTNSNGKVTTKDVYELIERQRLETKADVAALEKKVDKVLELHSTKLDTLENNQAKMFGGLAVVSVIWTWIINQIIR